MRVDAVQGALHQMRSILLNQLANPGEMTVLRSLSRVNFSLCYLLRRCSVRLHGGCDTCPAFRRQVPFLPCDKAGNFRRTLKSTLVAGRWGSCN